MCVCMYASKTVRLAGWLTGWMAGWLAGWLHGFMTCFGRYFCYTKSNSDSLLIMKLL